jgi:hypothetical protein
VLQARDDVETLPIDNVDYIAAAAFLSSGAAYWRRARDEVAAHLGMDGDALRRVGTAWVIKRRRAEGLPDQPVPPARPVTVTRAPLVVDPTMARPAHTPRYTQRRLPPERNPFNAFRRLAAAQLNRGL